MKFVQEGFNQEENGETRKKDSWCRSKDWSFWPLEADALRGNETALKFGEEKTGQEQSQEEIVYKFNKSKYRGEQVEMNQGWAL